MGNTSNPVKSSTIVWKDMTRYAAFVAAIVWKDKTSMIFNVLPFGKEFRFD